ncbi:MAG: RIP metalloprotease RseP, partial [Caldimonas sp.]
MITTILAFVLTLGVLIVIHEYGHYRVAVACGVKVLRFSVGFGRVLWRRQATPDSTEFVVCALPLGGYVRMLDEREAPVATEDLHRAFNRKPLLQRAAVVVAGPLANLLLAVVLYAATYWIGVDEPKALLGPPSAASLAERAGLHAGDWARAYSTDGIDWQDLRSLSDLRWEVTQAVLNGQRLNLIVSDRDGHGQRRVTLDLDTLGNAEVDAKLMQRIGIGGAYSEPVLGEVKPGGPAAKAGLQLGDRVLAIDGEAIDDASRIRTLIRASGSSGAARPMHWRV